MIFHPIRAFLVVGAVLGSLFALTQPVLLGFDEPVHFLRAWQVADGQLFGQRVELPNESHDVGARFPKAMIADVVVLLKQVLPKSAFGDGDARGVLRHLGDREPQGEEQFVGIPSAEVYPPLPYLPAALAIAFGRLIGASTLAMILLARLATLAACLAIVARGIHHMPRQKWLIVALGLTPVLLFQSAVVSADGMTLAVALLAIALARRMSTTPVGSLGSGLVVEAGLVSLALALCKPPYFLLIALFVPAVIRQRHNRASRALLGALVPSAIVTVAWSRYAQSLYVPQSNPFAPPKVGEYAYVRVDTQAQLNNVAHHPWQFLGTAARTFGHAPLQLIHDSVAQYPVVSLFPFAAALIALLAIATIAFGGRVAGDGDAAASPIGAERVVLIGVAVATAMVSLLLAYAGWNALRAPRVDAYQGRYLFPVVALLCVALLPALAKPNDTAANRRPLALIACAVAASALVLVGIARVYY